MRLVIVSPQFPAEPGSPTLGVGAATANLVDSLKHAEPDLDIHVVLVLGQARPPRRWGTACTLHSLAKPLGAVYAPFSSLRSRVVDRYVERLEPDLVHVQAWAGALDFDGPRVLTVHGMAERDVLFRGRRFAQTRAALLARRESAARGRYPHVIAIAGYVAQHLAGQVQGRLHFIRNALDPAAFAPLDPSPRAPILLQLGALSVLKNPLATVRALRILADRGIDAGLNLVGPSSSPAYERELQGEIERLRLTEHVTLAGKVDRAHAYQAYRQARALVMPSRQEVAPMAIAEAAANGLAALVAPVGGCPEMVAPGHAGELIDPDAPESIADAAEPFLLDARYALTRGERARALASPHRPETVARATLDVYAMAMR